jgi:hypothetical protein
MATDRGFLEAANKIGALTVEALKIQYRLQGHRLTGRLEKSISYKAFETTEGATVRITMEDYGIVLDQGISPNRIPFSGRTGGRTSKYIEGLKNFARRRFGVSNKEATRIAFAIANVQKKEGLSTKNSSRFSKTGKRQGAISAALLDTREEQERIAGEALQMSIELFFEQFIKSVAQ